MHLFMSRKLSGLSECCGTELIIAFERFSTRMDAVVLPQVLEERKPLPTDIANIFADGVVAASKMSLHGVQRLVYFITSLMLAKPFFLRGLIDHLFGSLFVHIIISLL